MEKALSAKIKPESKPKKLQNPAESSYSVALGITALAFLLGIVGGCIVSAMGGAAADDAIFGHLSPLAAEGSVIRPNIIPVLVGTFIYPLLCFVLSFSIPGVALIPITVAARGFLLSYAVASCIRVFGVEDGALFSLALLGPHLILSLPVLLIIATHGLLGSMKLISSITKKPVYYVGAKENFARLAIATLVLAAAAAAEMYLSPILVDLIARQA